MDQFLTMAFAQLTYRESLRDTVICLDAAEEKLYHMGNTQRAVFALDSTTIDICLSLFPWAKFRKHKGAVKLHTLLDVRSAMPQVIYISENRTDRI